MPKLKPRRVRDDYTEEVAALVAAASTLRWASREYPIPNNYLKGNAWDVAADILDRAAQWVDETSRAGYWVKPTTLKQLREIR